MKNFLCGRRLFFFSTKPIVSILNARWTKFEESAFSVVEGDIAAKTDLPSSVKLSSKFLFENWILLKSDIYSWRSIAVCLKGIGRELFHWRLKNNLGLGRTEVPTYLFDKCLLIKWNWPVTGHRSFCIPEYKQRPEPRYGEHTVP